LDRHKIRYPRDRHLAAYGCNEPMQTALLSEGLCRDQGEGNVALLG
jgi:hypothetical protein